MKKVFRFIYILMFVVYIFIVFEFTLLNRMSSYTRTFKMPFWEYYNLFTGNEIHKYAYLIIGNILLFVPFGFMFPTIFKRYHAFKSTFLTALLFSVSIELLQLITARGLCEFDDVFNNTLGAVIGYLLYKSFYTALKSRKTNKLQKGDV